VANHQPDPAELAEGGRSEHERLAHSSDESAGFLSRAVAGPRYGTDQRLGDMLAMKLAPDQSAVVEVGLAVLFIYTVIVIWILQ
jgi:hypothetical protein